MKDKQKKLEVELMILKVELAAQRDENINLVTKLVNANREIAKRRDEKEKQAAELIVANLELEFQNTEKGKRADELVIINKGLRFQNAENMKLASQLDRANRKLSFKNEIEEERAAALVLANDELIIQNKEKEKRASELQVANKELKQFAFIASHDLQEPLRTISNYIKVFELEHFHLLGEAGKQYILSINRAARRMSTLIEALLKFSRLGRDRKISIVDCNKIVKSVFEDLEPMIGNSKPAIIVVKLPVLNACEIEIYQLFQNLITNAIKFIEKDKRLRIKIEAILLGEKWMFSVSDNGIGIDPIHSERIFDLFQRLHSREKYTGNGIGLANCKKIVQLHHGEIWIESTVGKGTTFYFTIPTNK